MKNLTLIIGSLLLLQSCYNYKAIVINSKPLIEGKKYKFKVNNKTTKAIFINATDSTSTFKSNKRELKITTNEIQRIKQRKFSLTKTISFASSVVLITSTLVILDGLSHTNYYSDNGKPIVGP